MKRYWPIPLVVFLVSLATYLLTLTPTVDFIDSGEFAAAAHTLGIPHPTGYPLFTLLGNLWLRLPVAARPIARLNVMSAFFAALAAALFVVFANSFLKASTPGTRHGAKIRWLASGIGGLVLAWSAVFWETGTTLEVYSLHSCFTILLLLLAVFYTAERDEKRETVIGLLLFLALGLSFANHLTTGALLPAIALLLLGKWIGRKTPAGRIILIMLPFLLGAALYLYLPLRAAGRPVIMWGEPKTLKALWENLTVADFRHRLLSGQSEGETLLDFFVRIPRRTGFAPVPLMLAGAILLFRSSKKYFSFLLLAFLPATLYAATYNVGDNIFYYATGYICLAVFAALGIRALLGAVPKKRLAAAVLLLPALALPALFINYRAVDKSGNYFVEDYVRNVFSTIEPGAILFALDCQILVHPLYYYQHVEGFRPDVLVLSNHGLEKGWLAKRLKYYRPEVYEKSAREIEFYLRALERVSSGEDRDGGRLKVLYYRMLSSIISKNQETRPIYLTSEFDPNHTPLLHPGFRRVPEGLVWKLYRAGETPREIPYREFAYRELAYPHKDADAVRHAYMYMLKERARYEAARGDHDLARRWLDQGLRAYPGEPLLSEHTNGTRILPNRRRELLEIGRRIENLRGKRGSAFINSFPGGT